jgi:outer membrane receptor protein involved in Fe transport
MTDRELPSIGAGEAAVRMRGRRVHGKSERFLLNAGNFSVYEGTIPSSNWRRHSCACVVSAPSSCEEVPMNTRLPLTAAVAAALLVSIPAASAHARDDPSTSTDTATTRQELPVIEVIGITPLPGLGLPLDHVPFQVQQATGADMRKQQSLDMTDYLANNFSGVNINQTQDNPFQTNLRYHGFDASPLLGAPEGLSVYQDGVRVNEAFGSTVNWDLIPASSIESVSLMSGSNPMFGLNTLGGALSVRTKDGRHDPGTEFQAYGGSFQRSDGQFQTGGTRGNFDYFVTANYFHEDGWRDLSPSTVRQGFAKIGWQDDVNAVHLSYNWANNDLIGNGVTPRSMLAYRRQSIFTAPDETRNKLNFFNLTGSHYFSGATLLSGNLYYRSLDTRALNGDDNDDYGELDDDDDEAPAYPLTASPIQPADDDDFDYDEDCVPITADNIGACAPGINHASELRQRTLGGGLQLSDSHDLWGHQNMVVVGADFSITRTDFLQTQQLADLTPGRSTTIANPPYDDPAVNPLETVNDLSGHNKIFGFYVSDTFSPSDLWHVTVSARYNRIQPTLRGISIDGDGGGHAIDLDHSFVHINPAIGFTLTPNKNLTFYANYNQGNRAPTVIELGCADPDFPCGLPNDFASDPDLKQVIARTFEVGARGTLDGGSLVWNAGVFRTRASNDIEFIKTNLSEGFFDNVGKTRRQGIDLGVGGRDGKLTWHAAYSLVDATYQSRFTLSGGSNSSCVNPPDDDDDDDCLITVHPGNRIPLVPRNVLRLAIGYDFTPRFNIGANVIASSWQYLTGNENNANRPGGVTNDGEGDPVLGSGRIGGYTVVNLHANYQVTAHVDVFARIINLFDKHYATSGFLSDSGFNPDGSFRQDGEQTNEDMIAPAAPRAGWLGVRVSF